MIAALLTSATFGMFLVASLILAITPGPGVIYVVTRTLRQGRGAGLTSVLGIALGNFANAAAASLGLAALLAASASAFTILKLAGAAYLVFLGVRALMADPAAMQLATRGHSVISMFADGFIVALLNPKTALFFAALLPQFIDPAQSLFDQSLILGGVFVSIAACTDSMYVMAAAALSRTLGSRSAVQSWSRYLSAATFIGLGIFAAFASPRTSR
jgi:threonine/homoserine/homoserine lactone efflux protein